MKKLELQKRLKRLYIFLAVLIVLAVINQFYTGGLFELIPPNLATHTPGPTAAVTLPVATERAYPIATALSGTPTVTPTAFAYPIGSETPAAIATLAPDAYPVVTATQPPLGEQSYP